MLGKFISLNYQLSCTLSVMNMVTLAIRKILVLLLIAHVFGDGMEFIQQPTPVFNLHATLLNPDLAVLEYDCLYYYVDDSIVDYEVRGSLAHQIIRYCFRPTNETKGSDIPKRSLPEDTISWSFRDLKDDNITSEQLLSWSATIELVEDYEAFLSGHPLMDDSQRFYNCSLPWFGPRCEYAFVKFVDTTFSNIVREIFDRKMDDRPDEVPCYVLLKVKIPFSFALLIA